MKNTQLPVRDESAVSSEDPFHYYVFLEEDSHHILSHFTDDFVFETLVKKPKTLSPLLCRIILLPAFFDRKNFSSMYFSNISQCLESSTRR